ncbi:MAG: hypothetical protein KKC68_03690 [Candidatus Thermoplasmatota archaeon]|nr:hypothetical protein [Candidatus Thermoplasmatota archaeon]MBU1940852.1 hypothetical protein [Candidatus Thermoplasmatota archaeon]
MEIKDIEAAVDRMMKQKTRSNNSVDTVVKPIVHSSRFEEVICSERVERYVVSPPKKPVTRGRDHGVVCTGRHADLVQSIITAKKKAM